MFAFRQTAKLKTLYLLVCMESWFKMQVITAVLVGGLLALARESEQYSQPEPFQRNTFSSTSRVYRNKSVEVPGPCPGDTCACEVDVCQCCDPGLYCTIDLSHCCPIPACAVCGEYCLPPTYICCADGVCPPTYAQCCDDGCCPLGTTCCGEECCGNNGRCCTDDQGNRSCCDTSAHQPALNKNVLK